MVALPDAWDGKSRVTISGAGVGLPRLAVQADTPHSDTMILLSAWTRSRRPASMLSIARGSCGSTSPGFDYGRINEAYFDGEAFKLPGGGAELARQTVEQFIGVPVQYYAVIEF